MHGSPLVGWLLVVIASATGVSCLLRTGAGGVGAPGERRAARDEGLMGLGMALMAVPAPVIGQRPWGDVVLAVLFSALAVRFAVLARREGHRVHHAVEAAAMVYMAVAMGAGDGSGMAAMAGMGGGAVRPSGIPVVTGVLLAYFALYSLATGIQLLPATGPRFGFGFGSATAAGPRTGPQAGSVLRAPELASACRLSLGIGMFTMLLTM
jgi:hypothetical protein